MWTNSGRSGTCSRQTSKMPSVAKVVLLTDHGLNLAYARTGNAADRLDA